MHLCGKHPAWCPTAPCPSRLWLPVWGEGLPLLRVPAGPNSQDNGDLGWHLQSMALLTVALLLAFAAEAALTAPFWHALLVFCKGLFLQLSFFVPQLWVQKWAWSMAKSLSACIAPLSYRLILLLPSPTPPVLLPPEGPPTSLFPGCISWEASLGHEPYPPNADCICCLSTESLIQCQLAAMKICPSSIYPVRFYYHLKYSGTDLHP